METEELWIKCEGCGIRVYKDILLNKNSPHIKGKLAEHICKIEELK